MAGYDIGVGLSGSASSGASTSGTTEAGSGGNYGGQNFGPGSVVKNLPASTPLVKILWAAAAVIALVLIVPLLKGGK